MDDKAMIKYNNICFNRTEKLRYIVEHNRAFDVEYVYPLDIFEKFAETAINWGMDSSCKIEKERLYPCRFNLFKHNPNLTHIEASLDFLQKVQCRADVKLDSQKKLQQFLAQGIEVSKVKKILTGVDIRANFVESKVKIYFIIKDYPEKQEIAMSLHSENKSEDLQLLLINDHLLVGFDFYLDGRTNVELYPQISREQFQQVDVQGRFKKVLSESAFKFALQVVEVCQMMMFGFSSSNASTILYYYLQNSNDFINYFSINDTARRVHSYYQKQSLKTKGMWVGFPETELLEPTIQNINLYYQLNLLA